ncbi:MAG: hypothetical protein OT643_14330 [Bacteroidetes bacterium]|jgi:hypothetical protein|nr:hypothetical protein [Bacteroidota bacterium]
MNTNITIKYFVCFCCLLAVLFHQSCCSFISDCGDCYSIATYSMDMDIEIWDKPKGQTIFNDIFDPEKSSFVNENEDTSEYYGLEGEIIYLILSPEDPPLPVDTPYSKTYYLFLKGYDGIKKDIDTLKFDYEFKTDDCPPVAYKYLRVYYNDSLYYNGGFDGMMLRLYKYL